MFIIFWQVTRMPQGHPGHPPWPPVKYNINIIIHRIGLHRMSTSTCNRTYISVDTHSGFKTLMLLSKPDRCNRRCDRKSLSNSQDDAITTTDKICSHAATKVVDDDKTLSLLVTIFALCSAPTDAPRGREGRGGPGGHSATDGHWSVGGRVLSSDQASGDDGVTRHRTGDGPFSTKKA